jgi:hypothetical protein
MAVESCPAETVSTALSLSSRSALGGAPVSMDLDGHRGAAARVSAVLHNYTLTLAFACAGSLSPRDMDCPRRLSRTVPDAARYTRPWRVVGARRGELHA